MTKCNNPDWLTEDTAACAWLVVCNWHHFCREEFNTVTLNAHVLLRVLPTDKLAHLWYGVDKNVFAAALSKDPNY